MGLRVMVSFSPVLTGSLTCVVVSAWVADSVFDQHGAGFSHGREFVHGLQIPTIAALYVNHAVTSKISDGTK